MICILRHGHVWENDDDKPFIINFGVPYSQTNPFVDEHHETLTLFQQNSNFKTSGENRWLNFLCSDGISAWKSQASDAVEHDCSYCLAGCSLALCMF